MHPNNDAGSHSATNSMHRLFNDDAKEEPSMSSEEGMGAPVPETEPQKDSKTGTTMRQNNESKPKYSNFGVRHIPPVIKEQEEMTKFSDDAKEESSLWPVSLDDLAGDFDLDEDGHCGSMSPEGGMGMAISPEIGNAMQQNSESVPKYSSFAHAAEASSNRFGLKYDSGPQEKSFADGANAIEAVTNRKIQGQYPRVQPAMIPNASWFDGTSSTKDRQSTADRAPASSLIRMMGKFNISPQTPPRHHNNNDALYCSPTGPPKSSRRAEY